jgi:hypothetical protein
MSRTRSACGSLPKRWLPNRWRNSWRNPSNGRQRLDELKADAEWFCRLTAGNSEATAEYERLNRDLAGLSAVAGRTAANAPSGAGLY